MDLPCWPRVSASTTNQVLWNTWSTDVDTHVAQYSSRGLCHNKGVARVDMQSQEHSSELSHEGRKSWGILHQLQSLSGSGLFLGHQLSLPYFWTEHAAVVIWMPSSKDTQRKMCIYLETLYLWLPGKVQKVWAVHQKFFPTCSQSLRVIVPGWQT